MRVHEVTVTVRLVSLGNHTPKGLLARAEKGAASLVDTLTTRPIEVLPYGAVIPSSPDSALAADRPRIEVAEVLG